MRLLIVEDHEQMRRLLRAVVAGPGDETFDCPDGSGALAAYEACRPDWVLMDIEMPRVDGLTATAQIVRAHPEARILVVTEHDSEDLRAAAARAGARGYVLKECVLDVRPLLLEAGHHA